jgi:Aspartyl protease
MPPLEERISDDGPLITVGVGLSPLQATAARVAGFSTPPPELAQAMIDTGARVTCIDSKIARALDLRKTGTARMWTAGKTVTRAVYDIDFKNQQGHRAGEDTAAERLDARFARAAFCVRPHGHAVLVRKAAEWGFRPGTDRRAAAVERRPWRCRR